MIDNISGDSFLNSLSLIALAVIAFVVAIKKLVLDWKSSQAEMGLIEQMSEELKRLSDQNTTLSSELFKLQEEIIELNKQLNTLSIENNKLQHEISALTTELNNFKKLAALRKIKV